MDPSPSPTEHPQQQHEEINDIEEVHKNALLRESSTYIDPATGFTVFTELAHLRRGKCCGNACRHCPYGWSNVKGTGGPGSTPLRREGKLKSGDVAAARVLLDRIGSEAAQYAKAKEAVGEDATAPCEIERCSNLSRRTNGSHTDVGGGGLNVSKTDTLGVTTTKSEAGKGGRHGGRRTTKNVPYTRGGDKGTSQLFTGERRSKDDAAFEALGTVDELCSVVGTVHAELMVSLSLEDEEGKDGISYGELPEWLLDVMSRLFDIGSHVAKPVKRLPVGGVDDGRQLENEDFDDDDCEDTQPLFSADGVGGGFDSDHIDILEDWIDVLTEALPELDSFILPTGGRASAQLHVARCVCRRAERRLVGLVDGGVCDPTALRYLNRLSDFFFTAARWTNYCEGREELQYRRHHRGAKQRNRVAVSLQESDKPSEGR